MQGDVRQKKTTTIETKEALSVAPKHTGRIRWSENSGKQRPPGPAGREREFTEFWDVSELESEKQKERNRPKNKCTIAKGNNASRPEVFPFCSKAADLYRRTKLWLADLQWILRKCELINALASFKKCFLYIYAIKALTAVTKCKYRGSTHCSSHFLADPLRMS